MRIRTILILMLIPVLLGCNRESRLPEDPDRYITERRSGSTITLARAGECVPIMVSREDHEGVILAVSDLQSDLKKVTGHLPEVLEDGETAGEVILVGTAGQSPDRQPGPGRQA